MNADQQVLATFKSSILGVHDEAADDEGGPADRSHTCPDQAHNSGALKLAAKITSATEDAVLRASNGPYRRDCSSTDRILFVRGVKWFGEAGGSLRGRGGSGRTQVNAMGLSAKK